MARLSDIMTGAIKAGLQDKSFEQGYAAQSERQLSKQQSEQHITEGERKRKGELQTLQDLTGADNPADAYAIAAKHGAGVHMGDVSIQTDPYAKQQQHQTDQEAKASKAAFDSYSKQTGKLPQVINSVNEIMDQLKDPNGISPGIIKTKMISALGMNRYNAQEAAALLPPTAREKLEGLLTFTGMQSQPITPGSPSHQALQKFSQDLLNSAQSAHNQAKQSAIGMYSSNPYASPARSEMLKQTIGKPTEDMINDTRSKFQMQQAPQPGTPVPQAAPKSILDRLKAAYEAGTQPSTPQANTTTPPQGLSNYLNPQQGNTPQAAPSETPEQELQRLKTKHGLGQ